MSKVDPKSPAPEPTPDPVTETAANRLQEALADAVIDVTFGGRHPSIRVAPAAIRDVCLLLRDHPDLRYDCCHLVSGVDWPATDELEVVYHLVSYARKTDDAYRARAEKNDPWLCVKARVPRDEPRIPSVADIWTGADWHERETFDLLGIVFTGRPELRRILLPEDWPGHPLRKDWEFPVSYHGIPIIPPEAQP